MVRREIAGEGGMTSGGGPREASTIQPTKAASTRPLWEQPSFLVTLALCAVGMSAFVSGSEAALAARPEMTVVLVATLVGYVLYRKKRGWRALPTSGWLPSRQTSRRRWVGLGLYAFLLVVLASLGMPRTTSGPGVADTAWTKSMATTTCGDWLSVMTDRQRQAFAEALLTYDLSKPHGPALDQTNDTEYISVITDTCRNDSPSSLVVQ
jgi:hypothetical protein